MPLAILLGKDKSNLNEIQFSGAKVLPENLVLIGKITSKDLGSVL